MAGDWIKMRVWLKKDPRVIFMADYLADDKCFQQWLTDPVRQSCKVTAYEHVTRDVCVALCVTGLLVIWGTAREQGTREKDDLVMGYCDIDGIDAIADLPGIGMAMTKVGWLVEDSDNTIRFPNFFRDKETPEKRFGTSAAERQARYRQNKKKNNACDVTSDVTGCATSDATGDVTRCATLRPREEERREEKNKENTGGTPPTPRSEADSSSQAEFLAAWNAIPQFAKALELTKKRLAAFRSRMNEPMFSARWREALAIASKLPWCRGENDRGWRATADWFLRPDTVTKLLEGGYGGVAANGPSGAGKDEIARIAAQMEARRLEDERRRALIEAERASGGDLGIVERMRAKL